MTMGCLRAFAICLAVSFAAACDGGPDDASGFPSMPDAMAEPPVAVLVPDNDLTVPGPGYTAPGALAFRVVDGTTGVEVAPAAFWQALSVARLVCTGEVHDEYFSHSLQYLIARTLGAGKPSGVTLALEQFEVGFQSTLDQFTAGLIDENQLLAQSQYDKRWGFPWALYRPIVLLGPKRQYGLLAANPTQEITRKVTDTGLASLSPSEQAQLPELDLTNAAHREWFRAQISGAHGAVTGDRFENLYASQVIRDETMADRIVTRLVQPGAERALGIIGFGHCVRHGIPMRAARRGLTGIVNLRTVDATQAAVNAAVAEQLFTFVLVPGA
jgi:uncharacterized iron-regulated protein